MFMASHEQSIRILSQCLGTKRALQISLSVLLILFMIYILIIILLYQRPSTLWVYKSIDIYMSIFILKILSILLSVYLSIYLYICITQGEAQHQQGEVETPPRYLLKFDQVHIYVDSRLSSITCLSFLKPVFILNNKIRHSCDKAT